MSVLKNNLVTISPAVICHLTYSENIYDVHIIHITVCHNLLKQGIQLARVREIRENIEWVSFYEISHRNHETGIYNMISNVHIKCRKYAPLNMGV